MNSVLTTATKSRLLSATLLTATLVGGAGCGASGNSASDDSDSVNMDGGAARGKDSGKDSGRVAPVGDDAGDDDGGPSSGDDAGPVDSDSGTPSEAGSDTDSSTMPPSEAGTSSCPASGIKPSEVVMIGDSYLDDNWSFTGAMIMDDGHSNGRWAHRPCHSAAVRKCEGCRQGHQSRHHGRRRQRHSHR